MALVKVFLAPDNVLRDFSFSKEQMKMAIDNLAAYEKVAEYTSNHSGIDAAESAFEMTNSPMHQQRRSVIYGRHRSISTGDIVEVDNMKYLCMSLGWKEIPTPGLISFDRVCTLLRAQIRSTDMWINEYQKHKDISGVRNAAMAIGKVAGHHLVLVSMGMEVPEDIIKKMEELQTVWSNLKVE